MSWAAVAKTIFRATMRRIATTYDDKGLRPIPFVFSSATIQLPFYSGILAFPGLNQGPRDVH